ncbi:hypothetical protein ACWGID_20150 [Kribbella sp. NPDC054772]
MSEQENIFLQSSATAEEEATGLRELLGLEPIPDTSGAGPDEFGLRGPAATVDGVLGYIVQPNDLVVEEDAQATDHYPIEIEIWLGNDEAVQRHEARLVFDRLVAARPDVPMLLCHDLDVLVAAYRPGQGVHEFPAGTTVDAPDAAQWRPWVVAGQEV